MCTKFEVIAVKKKLKLDKCFMGNPSCHTGSHNVTCHRHKRTHPTLTLASEAIYLPTLEE